MSLRVLVFLNSLGLGGTEKAGCRWALGLKERGHEVMVLALNDGPRRAELEPNAIPVRSTGLTPQGIADVLREMAPDIIHAHVPGHPHEGDVLGEALALLPRKIPVVQTNIFGKFHNPREHAWTDFRLFISWTSCVQAARRVFRRPDRNFLRQASVAVYPLDALAPPPPGEVAAFRKSLAISDDEVLFGRFSRPEPNKWTDLALDAFHIALRRNRKIKLLLREPPPLVAEKLRLSSSAGHFIILPATADADELRRTMSVCDVVLHTSSMGESFGYGIAEPMNLGKPVVTHSVPWLDQAQIELVRNGECGRVASTPATMGEAIFQLANDSALRRDMGAAAQRHIRALADPKASLDTLEQIFLAVLQGRDNPFVEEDLRRVREAAAYLDAHQFGYTLKEQWVLRRRYYYARLFQFRTALRGGRGNR